MVKVKIRHEDDEHAVPLCEIAVDRLEWLIAEIPRWGVYVHGSADECDLTGEFQVTDAEAYFEIVIHEKEEPKKK